MSSVPPPCGQGGGGTSKQVPVAALASAPLAPHRRGSAQIYRYQRVSRDIWLATGNATLKLAAPTFAAKGWLSHRRPAAGSERRPPPQPHAMGRFSPAAPGR